MRVERFMRGIGVVAVVVTACFLALYVWAGVMACSTDTSYCAGSTDKNGLYRGVLDLHNRPAVRTSFSVGFASVGGLVGGFSTDAAGSYCILWAPESIPPDIYVRGRFVGPIPVTWQPLNGSAPPRGCQGGDASIPWYSADGVTSRWQYIVVAIGGLVSLVALFTGMATKSRGGYVILRAGLLLTVVTVGGGVIIRWVVGA